MTAPRRSLIAGTVAAWCYVAMVIELVLAYRYEVVAGGAGGVNLSSYLDTVLFTLAWSGFPVVGALVAVRRPDNPVGWSILIVGFSMYGFAPLIQWAALVLVAGGEVTGPLLWGLGVANALAVLPIVAFTHLLLFFPDGVPTPWSRWLSWIALTAAGLATLARLLRPARLDLELEVGNPFGVAGVPAGEELVLPLTVALSGTAVLALGRLVVRHRRAGAVERKQFQWILASIATFPVLWMLGNSLEEVNYNVGQFTSIAAFDLAFIGFTVALYRAVTKQDLYGIDRLVSRTLTYASVSVLLVATYLGLVVGLGTATRAVTGESGDLVVAVSTLAVAALFQPLRRRVRMLVDRRFNRARYDADRTVEAFGRGLRDQVSLDAVVGELAGTAAAVMHPKAVGVVLTAPVDGSG